MSKVIHIASIWKRGKCEKKSVNTLICFDMLTVSWRTIIKKLRPQGKSIRIITVTVLGLILHASDYYFVNGVVRMTHVGNSDIGRTLSMCDRPPASMWLFSLFGLKATQKSPIQTLMLFIYRIMSTLQLSYFFIIMLQQSRLPFRESRAKRPRERVRKSHYTSGWWRTRQGSTRQVILVIAPVFFFCSTISERK